MFVTCVMRRVLWWLCGVGEGGFCHVIIAICVVHRCRYVLVVGMGRLMG